MSGSAGCWRSSATTPVGLRETASCASWIGEPARWAGGGFVRWRVSSRRIPEAGYYAYRVQLSFDEESRLLIRVVVYDWSDQLIEDFSYTELRINPGLTGLDFDPSNKEYGFSIWRIQISG